MSDRRLSRRLSGAAGVPHDGPAYVQPGALVEVMNTSTRSWTPAIIAAVGHDTDGVLCVRLQTRDGLSSCNWTAGGNNDVLPQSRFSHGLRLDARATDLAQEDARRGTRPGVLLEPGEGVERERVADYRHQVTPTSPWTRGMTLVMTTDGNGVPNVEVVVDTSKVAPSHLDETYGAVFHTTAADIGARDGVVSTAYYYMFLLNLYLTGGLPSAWGAGGARQWTHHDVVRYANGASSANQGNDNSAATNAADEDLWATALALQVERTRGTLHMAVALKQNVAKFFLFLNEAWRKTHLVSASGVTTASSSWAGSSLFTRVVTQLNNMRNWVVGNTSSSAAASRAPATVAAAATTAERGGGNTEDIARAQEGAGGGDAPGRAAAPAAVNSEMLDTLLKLVAELPRKEEPDDIMVLCGIGAPTGMHFLVYFFGKMLAAERAEAAVEEDSANTVSDSNAGVKGWDVDANPIESFQALRGEYMRVLLMSWASGRFVPGEERFRSTGIVKDKEKLAAASLKMLSSFAAMSSLLRVEGTDDSGTKLRLFIGTLLLLDGRGVGDATMAQLAHHGITCTPQAARKAIHIANKHLKVSTVLGFEEEQRPATAFAADNCDIRVWNGIHNLILITLTTLGFQLTAAEVHLLETEHVHTPPPSIEDAHAMELTADDLAVVDRHRQALNVYALQSYLVTEDDLPSLESGLAGNSGATGEAEVALAVGVRVRLTYAGQEAVGTIRDTKGGADGLNYEVVVVAADGEERRVWRRASYLMAMTEEEADAALESKGGDESAGVSSAAPREKDPAVVTPIVAAHPPFDPTRTTTADVLNGVSSKHMVATAAVTTRVANVMERNNWSGVVFCGFDFEFFTNAMLNYFISGVWLIPVLALGHLCKSTSTAMITQSRTLITDPLLKAAGYKRASPRYNKLVNGRHISKTVKAVIGMGHATRLSLAEMFIAKHGDDTFGDTTVREALMLPQPEAAPVEVILDQAGRPWEQAVSVQLIQVAKLFQAWLDHQAGVGDDQDEATPAAAAGGGGGVQNDMNPEHTHIFSLPFRATATEIGLWNRCKLVKLEFEDFIIPEVGAGRTAKVLMAKYYAFENAGGGVAGVAAANAATPALLAPAPEAKAPTEANVSMRHTHSFLSYQMVSLSLMAVVGRVRDPDTSNPDNEEGAAVLPACTRCAKPAKECRCTHYHKWIVALKMELQCVFQRRQPNYQRSLAYFLTLISCVLRHPNMTYARLVLRHLRCTCALSVAGDALACQPVDLHQEHWMDHGKQDGSRKPSETLSTEARIKVGACIRLQRLVAKYRVGQTCAPGSSASQSDTDKEFHQYKAFVFKARAVVAKIVANEDTTKVAGTALGFSNRDRVFHLVPNAAAYARQAVSALVQGLAQQVSVDMPARVPPGVREIHCEPAAGATPTHVRQAARAAAAHQAAQRVAVEKEKMGVVMLSGLSDAVFTGNFGAGKAALVMTLLQQFLHLKSPDGRPAFIVSESRRAETAHLQAEVAKVPVAAGQVAPVVVVLDFLQQLQEQPMLRPGVDDSFRELARSIIILACKEFAGNSAVKTVIVCIDANNHMTFLRLLQLFKRWKQQAPPDYQAADFASKSPDALLGTVDSFCDGMKGKYGWAPFLMELIQHEMLTVDRDHPKWDPKEIIQRGHTLVLLGPGIHEDVAEVATYHPARKIELFVNCSVSVTDLCAWLSDVAQAGEGEAMVFRVAWLLYLLAMKHALPGLVVAPLILVRSADTDAVAGHMVPVVLAVLFHLQRSGELGNDFNPLTLRWHGRLWLQMHSKNVETMRHMGARLQPRTNGGGRANGKHAQLLCDCFAFVRGIECLESLPPFSGAFGERALAVTGGIHALQGNDYLDSMVYGHGAFMAALLSPRFAALANLLPCGGAPVTLTMPRGGGLNKVPVFAVSYAGAALLLYVVMGEQRRTKAQLLMRYTTAELSTMGIMTYDVLRGAAVVGAEMNLLPSEVALLIRLAAVICVFNLMANQLFSLDPVVGTKAELDRYPHESDGKGGVMLQYRLGLPKVGCGQGARGRRNQAVIAKVLAWLGLPAVQGAPPCAGWPFRPPLEVLEEAVVNKGVEAVRHVPANLVYPAVVLQSEVEAAALQQGQPPFAALCRDAKQHTLVLRSTLLMDTPFLPRGLGKPQLDSATMAAVASGQGTWIALSNWPASVGGEAAKEKKVGGVVAAGKGGDAEALLLLHHVVRHVLKHCKEHQGDMAVADTLGLADETVETEGGREGSNSADEEQEEDGGDEVDVQEVAVVGEMAEAAAIGRTRNAAEPPPPQRKKHKR